ncbi:MAG: hypothetical protein ACRDDZ_01400 [Marinifilaceae bacterium]
MAYFKQKHQRRFNVISIGDGLVKIDSDYSRHYIYLSAFILDKIYQELLNFEDQVINGARYSGQWKKITNRLINLKNCIHKEIVQNKQLNDLNDELYDIYHEDFLKLELCTRNYLYTAIDNTSDVEVLSKMHIIMSLARIHNAVADMIQQKISDVTGKYASCRDSSITSAKSLAYHYVQLFKPIYKYNYTHSNNSTDMEASFNIIIRKFEKLLQYVDSAKESATSASL